MPGARRCPGRRCLAAASGARSPGGSRPFPAARTALLAVAAGVPRSSCRSCGLGVRGDGAGGGGDRVADLATIAEHQSSSGIPSSPRWLSRGTPAARRRVHAALADALGPERGPGSWRLPPPVRAPPRPTRSSACRRRPRLGARTRRRGRTRAGRTAEPGRRRAAPAAARRRPRGAGRGPRRQARTLLAEAAATAPPPAQRLQAEHLLGHAELWGGDVASRARSSRAAEAIAGADPMAGAGALADAAMAAASWATAAADRARRARSALLGDGGDPSTRAHVLGTLVWLLVLRGQARRRSRCWTSWSSWAPPSIRARRSPARCCWPPTPASRPRSTPALARMPWAWSPRCARRARSPHR